MQQFALAGGPDFQSEIANVLELGYRAQPSPTLSWSATMFASRYDKLRTLEPVAGQGAQFRNMGEGTARGLEMWARWQVREDWRRIAVSLR